MRIKFTEDERREFLKVVENDDFEEIVRIIKLDEAVNDKRWRKEFEGYLDCIAEYDEVDLDKEDEIDYNSPKTMETLRRFIIDVTVGDELFKERRRKELAHAKGLDDTPADGVGLW